MKELILPYGYKCEIINSNDFIIYSPLGYFKMNRFPHKFWDAIYEYGDNQGHKWNADGEPLTKNTEKDVDFNKLNEIVGFSSVKEKLVVRQRVLDEYNRLFKKNIK
jgi:hypothetical protein